MSTASDDLSLILVPPPSQSVRYGQGTIIAWDPDTLENTISWRGVHMHDLPVLAGVSALSYRPGDIVGLLGWDAGGRHGAGSWWILGRLAVPGGESPDVVIRGSDLIVDGGEIRSSNFNGETSNDDPGSQGWALGNDKLALLGAFVPAVDSSSHEDLQSGFSIGTGVTPRASVTVTVPSWAQQASVLASCMFSLSNTSGGSRTVMMAPRIDGTPGFNITRTLSDGVVDVWSISQSRTFDVSSVGAFDVDALMNTASDTIPAHAANAATVSALVLFKSTQ